MFGKLQRAMKHFDKSIAIAKRQQSKYEYAQTLLAKAELEAELDQPEALSNKAEAQAILGELHAYETHENAQRETAEPATLSLADRFDAVLDWGRRIASALSAPVILGEARVAALRLLRAEHCMVLQIMHTGGEAEFIALSGRIPGSCNQAKLKESLQVRRAVAFLEHAAQQGSESAAAGRERSALCAPIYVRGVALACLYVTHEQVRGLFGSDEERLADYIATIAGAALENAEGFAQLQALNETLEMRVADRTAAVEARSRELAQSNEELERTAGELMQAQQQLTVAKQAAEAASEAKSRFLAMMSHEIRTPLNGVIGMTELTLNSALSAPQRNHLTVVRDSAQSLLAILNDVLDFSKIEAGRLDLENIPLSVRDTIEDATRLLAVPAARKGLELTCHVAQNVPDQLLGDPIRLRQIVLNLVGNAIKFTEHGEVFVSANCRERIGNKCVLHIAVNDSGIGIAPEKQQSIFEAFRQNDSSMTRRFGGTGLGLSISSQIVGLMGGRIWVESQLGVGSTFQFVVPMELASTPESLETPTAFGRQGNVPRSVVCISANQRAREAHASMLLARGFEVATADVYESVEQILAKCRVKHSGALVELLVIDISAANSVVEIELLEALQAELHAAVPIVALVAPAASAEVAEHCLELGCEQCLTKPVKMQELEAAVKTALNCNRELSTSDGDADPNRAARSLHILVADDSPVNLEVAAGLLELRGHKVRTANSGREALSLWQNDQFDVVLMDLEMHDMDGLATTAAMREREQADVNRQSAPTERSARSAKRTSKMVEAATPKSRTPIVAMTAHAGQGFQQRCQAAGMDAYISKPFEPDELFRIVEGFYLSESAAGEVADHKSGNTSCQNAEASPASA
jgi:two-component system sensor kinase